MSSTTELPQDAKEPIPKAVRELLESEIQEASATAGSFVLEFSRITPHGGVLNEGCIANILMLLFTWGNKSNFDGYNCPVQKIKVTEGGPIFDLQKLGYGNEFVLTNQYPQLSKEEVLVIGVLISLNLCRKNSKLKVINLEGNAIEEEVFLRYVLSAISFDKQHGYGGTFLLRHPDLCLDEHKIQVLLEQRYFIEEVDDAEGTDYVYRKKRVIPTIEGQDKNYSPIESINFSRNKVVSFYQYFNHHPNLKHLNLGHTEYCGKRMLYTMDEKGNLRPEIKKGSKFDVEDRFTTQPKYYIRGTEEVDKRRRSYLEEVDKRRR